MDFWVGLASEDFIFAMGFNDQFGANIFVKRLVNEKYMSWRHTSKSSFSSTSGSTLSSRLSSSTALTSRTGTTISGSSTITLNSSSTFSSTSMSASPTKAVRWYAAGCYVDAGGSRTLRYGMQVPGGAGSMTVEACNSVCQDSKFTIAGVEYGGECCKWRM